MSRSISATATRVALVFVALLFAVAGSSCEAEDPPRRSAPLEEWRSPPRAEPPAEPVVEPEPVEPAPVETVVWEPSVPDEWLRVEGDGFVVRAPPGFTRRMNVLDYRDGAIIVGTSDPFTMAAVAERPRLEPGEVSPERCMEYLQPAALFAPFGNGESLRRPQGTLLIAQIGDMRACVFDEGRVVSKRTALVASPGANFWVQCHWYSANSPVDEACSGVARSWEIPASAPPSAE